MTPILDGSDDGIFYDELDNVQNRTGVDEESWTSVNNINDSEPEYPTEWHMLDIISKVECRQLSFDTYELRSPNELITLNQEGFNLYRDGSEAGKVIFTDWLKRHNIEIRLRPSDGPTEVLNDES